MVLSILPQKRYNQQKNNQENPYLFNFILLSIWKKEPIAWVYLNMPERADFCAGIDFILFLTTAEDPGYAARGLAFQSRPPTDYTLHPIYTRLFNLFS